MLRAQVYRGTIFVYSKYCSHQLIKAGCPVGGQEETGWERQTRRMLGRRVESESLEPDIEAAI